MRIIASTTLPSTQDIPQLDVMAAFPSSSDQIATICAQSVSEPIKEFHVFPKLPIELRLKIFRTAVPDTVPSTVQVMLDCEVECPATEPGVCIATGLIFRFSNEYEIRTSKLDLALLSTSYESRVAYKLANPNFLPLGDSHGLFYYNATFDVVYITNFSYLLFDQPLNNLIRSWAASSVETPKFISDIKKLAVTSDTFTEWKSGASKKAVGDDGIGRLVDFFGSLEVMAAVIMEDDDDWQAPIAVMREYWDEKVNYFRDFFAGRRCEDTGVDYKIPKIVVVDDEDSLALALRG